MIAIVKGILIGVDPEEIIERQRREISAASHRDSERLLPDSRLGGADVRAVLRRQALDLFERRQRRRSLQIVDNRVVPSKIREQNNSESDPCFFNGDLRFLSVALALRELYLRLYDVRVRHFAALFLLLGDVGELPGFAQTQLR